VRKQIQRDGERDSDARSTGKKHRPNRKKQGVPSKRKGRGKPDLEGAFRRRWRDLGGPKLAEQVKFHPTAGWKMDFCHLATMVAIEVHGGVFSRGRHVTGVGFSADRLKFNAAARCGWVTFELVPTDLEDERVYREIFAEIEWRTKHPPAPRPVLTGTAPFEGVHAQRLEVARRRRAKKRSK
jgi:hypothetical protein